ncbi:hemK methyltransferase family member 1-like [Mizuhopecten yessoensis]|uniref:hemK methyltransferase family member 1-like n=1 Tax=Mizuhopecten yessoensis TaxID=6573 RepID=UPI000B45C9B2|nr:hemK methyltransferase family member 1-like [Mizuhopecten yessoensis]XP_021360344.1 hemK methyltransferase family member 1-like [Mizuhopecten yessoensis]XP_021360352.1 hemK methyltransferase family member 1-like [Mizuhopecten yessoensis]XP_021360361.1 hemK methyltransferase family member 1-like [Mizuhopecten yessoensis]
MFVLRTFHRQCSQFARRWCHTTTTGIVSPNARTPGEVEAHPQSVKATVDKWTHWLEGGNVPEAKESVQLIIASVLGHKMIHDVSEELMLNENQTARIAEMCRKRYKRMPVQYIIEEWDFHDLTLKMRPPVFIPRPETEELAQLAYNDIKKKQDSSKPIRILELGSGSGAISVYLLNKLPQSEVVAVDRSGEACALTGENAECTGVQKRLTTLLMDYSRPESLPTLRSHGLYDLVIANPPYIPTDEIETMETELTRYEDPHAFHGGKDGLDYVRIILSMSTQLLKPNSALWFEVGLGHCDAIRSEVTKEPIHGLRFCSAVKDFTNRDRFCVLRT